MNPVDPTVLVLLLPVVAVQLGLLVYAVLDLGKPERRVRGGSKPAWALVIVLVSLIGPLVYLLAGREESAASPDGTQAGTRVRPPDDDAVPPHAAPRTSGHEAVRESGSAAIATRDLTKRYGGASGVLALDRLSLVVPSGSVFGLLGPNGAGKTTALRLLVGSTRPTAGGATVDGHAVDFDALAVRRHLGYLEQEPRGYGWMTGREQVELLARLHGLVGPAADDAVQMALARVGLADAADRRVATYSGGMRQRLGIAGALVHRPAVVVLDEPVSALDPEGRRDVLALIHDLRGDATVLFSSHVLADVERICDRVAILDRGRLVIEGPLAILDRYALPVYRVEAEPGQAEALEVLARHLDDLAWVTATSVDHGLLTVAVGDPERAARELLAVVARAGLAVISVARARPTLEDVFLRLTGSGTERAA